MTGCKAALIEKDAQPKLPMINKEANREFHEHQPESPCFERTTIIQAVFASKPGTGGNDLPIAEGILKKAAANDVMHEFIMRALHQATGVFPEIDDPPKE